VSSSFAAVGGRKSPFPITSAVGLYNSLFVQAVILSINNAKFWESRILEEEANETETNSLVVEYNVWFPDLLDWDADLLNATEIVRFPA